MFSYLGLSARFNDAYWPLQLVLVRVTSSLFTHMTAVVCDAVLYCFCRLRQEFLTNLPLA
jgi:hypothetical protein